ncbi:uncharacterized protein [Medicago truncatula]|uniref:uncharacterized protein n=1 Tax=Medicago truncatula TaxID=3880 RepID=UPI000D2F2EA5|nr:uncharacterized protein LOC112416726 [Medicago truncatula]
MAEMANLGWGEGGEAWGWQRRLLAWEEESVRECSAMLSNVVLQDHIQDFWRWLLDPIHGYTVRGTYRFLTSDAEPVVEGVQKNVWHKLVPSKVALFVWRLLQDKVPTRANLVRRNVIQPNGILCAGGCGNIETADHLFLGCNLFGSVWYLICNWLGICYVPSCQLSDHFLQFSNMASMPRFSHTFFKVIWLASIWAIWKDRNNCIFKNAVIDPQIILEKVKRDSFFWLYSNRISLAFGFHDWWRHPLLCLDVK